MEPMKPMKPMEPMAPMDFGPAWWPKDLGQPASSGGQDEVKYAFFPEKRRLAIREGGQVTVYDSGDHRISGVSQQRGGGRSLAFSSDNGEVTVEDLREVGPGC